MKDILEKFFKDYPVCAFSKLQDKSIISLLNHNQLDFADDGYRFYDYIENGTLKTRKINSYVNWTHIVGINRDNKKDYIYPAEYFKELPIVLEFTSFQYTIMFHKRGRFGLEKAQNSEINVKVVLDMGCGNI